MARLPPNQSSRHRIRGSSTRANNRSSSLASANSTGTSASRSSLYSSGDATQSADSLANNSNEDSGAGSSNSTPTTTPGVLDEGTLTSSTCTSNPSVVSTPSSSNSRSVVDDLLVPSPPVRRSDCLTPLNLSSAINRGGNSSSSVAFGQDFMAKMDAFFERQTEFNDRLEQRVAERLEKEREKANSKRLPKAVSVSDL